MNDKIKKLKNIISATVYMILVFVVIYGISNGVYDGFPKIIPYIIITIFIFMAFMRLYQFVVKLNSDSEENEQSEPQVKNNDNNTDAQS